MPDRGGGIKRTLKISIIGAVQELKAFSIICDSEGLPKFVASFDSDILVCCQNTSEAAQRKQVVWTTSCNARGENVSWLYPLFSTACQLSLYTFCLCGTKVSDFSTTSVCTPYQNFSWWMSGKLFLYAPFPSLISRPLNCSIFFNLCLYLYQVSNKGRRTVC